MVELEIRTQVCLAEKGVNWGSEPQGTVCLAFRPQVVAPQPSGWKLVAGQVSLLRSLHGPTSQRGSRACSSLSDTPITKRKYFREQERTLPHIHTRRPWAQCWLQAHAKRVSSCHKSTVGPGSVGIFGPYDRAVQRAVSHTEPPVSLVMSQLLGLLTMCQSSLPLLVKYLYAPLLYLVLNRGRARKRHRSHFPEAKTPSAQDVDTLSPQGGQV